MAAARTSSGEALAPVVDNASSVAAESEMFLVDSLLLQPVVEAVEEEEMVDCRPPRAENPRIQIRIES